MRRLKTFLADVYFTVDPRSLGLFRIGFGAVLFFDLYRRFLGLDYWYTNQGILPNHTLLWSPPGRHILSFFYTLSTHDEALGGMLVCAAVFAAYTLGWHTKLFQVLALVCLVSLDARIPGLENGGDVVLNLLCVWSLFLPLGRRFSLDALLASLRARRERGPDDLADRDSMRVGDVPVRSLAMFALILQFFAIYLFNVAHKTGPSWKTGTAVHLVLHQDRIVTALGVWMRDLPVEFLRFMAYSTLVIETLGVALIISPIFIRYTRLLAFFLMPFLHVAFAACLDLGPFSYAMMAFFPLLLHRTHWDWVTSWSARRRPERIVHFDATCGICFQFARILARLDRAGRIRLLPNDAASLPAGLDPTLADHSILVRDTATGALYTRTHGMAEIIRALPCGGPVWLLLRVPGVSTLCDVAYDAVARNRARLSQWSGFAACGVGPVALRAAADAEEPTPGARSFARARWLTGQVLCAIVLAATITEVSRANAAMPARLRLPQPQFLRSIIEYGRLFQGWRMFAPHAPPEDFNVSVEAWTVDGRMVDPYNEVASRQKKPPFTEIPARLGQDQFFTSYSLFIHEGSYRPYWGAFQEWILHYHERTGHPKDRIVRFVAYKLSDRSPPMGQTKPRDFRKRAFITYPPGAR